MRVPDQCQAGFNAILCPQDRDCSTWQEQYQPRVTGSALCFFFFDTRHVTVHTCRARTRPLLVPRGTLALTEMTMTMMVAMTLGQAVVAAGAVVVVAAAA